MQTTKRGSQTVITLAAVGCLLAPWRLAAAGEGKILYARQAGERSVLHVMNADGSGDKELPGQTAQQCLFPSWSPDGKRIAYTAAGGGGEDLQIVLANADGSAAGVVNTGSRMSGLAAWSPDGKQLAFACGDNHPEIFVGDADGNDRRPVSNPGDFAMFPFWTRDGKSVGFTHALQGPRRTEILLKPLDGGEARVLVQGEGMLATGPNALSPDGKRLAFLLVDLEGKKGSLRTLELANGGEATLLELDLSYVDKFNVPIPGWSPDGKGILLPLVGEKGRGLFQISEDGQTKKRLTPEGVDCTSGCWLPG